jgi:hypothetical protein
MDPMLLAKLDEITNTLRSMNIKIDTLVRDTETMKIGIKQDIAHRVRKLLSVRFPGYTVKALKNKTFNDPHSQRNIATFDQVFIVSCEGFDLLRPYRHLVLLNAAYHVTFDSINQTLENTNKVHMFLDEAKTYARDRSQISTWTPAFRKHVDQYSFDTIDDVYLCLGGHIWEEGTVSYVHSIKRFQNKLFHILPTPREYDMYDGHEHIKAANETRTLSYTFGSAFKANEKASDNQSIR